MNNISSFKKKLAAYSAMAAALACAKETDAQIVFTDVDPDFKSTFWDVNDYALDLNNDGTFDFRIDASKVYGTASGGYFTGSVSVQGYGNNEVVAVPYNIWWAKLLHKGDFIGPILPWHSMGYMAGTYDDADADGFWNNQKKQYLGLKLEVNSNTYYGWARLDVAYHHNRYFKIREYAYDSIPDHTLLAGQLAGCSTDNFEPNDSKSLSAAIPVNEVETALIGNPLDIDWFVFEVTSQEPNIRVLLFNLPDNYNIQLYNSANDKIGNSENKSLLRDTISVNNLAEGTYFVKVRGKAGSYSPVFCYSLLVSSSNIPWRIEDNSADFLSLEPEFDLYPNPVSDRVIIESASDQITMVGFRIFNLVGKKVYEQKEVPLNDRSSTELDVSKFAAGEYFLEIRFSEGVVVKKFVVQK